MDQEKLVTFCLYHTLSLSLSLSQPGCIDKFGNKVEELNVQTIINFVATETENQGRFEDAIRLYDLAQVSTLNHMTVI